MKILRVSSRPILAFLLSLFFILGCSPSRPAGASAEGAAAQSFTDSAESAWAFAGALAEANAPHPEIRLPGFALLPESARPGEPVTVAYSDNFAGPLAGSLAGPGVGLNLQAVLIDSRGRRAAKAAFFSLPGADGEQEIKAAILALPTTIGPGGAFIRIESGDSLIKELPLQISGRDFISETIALDQENTNLRTVSDPQKTAESEKLWAILSRTGTEIYSEGAFIPPVNSNRRTSFYGDRRVYRYSDGTSDTTIHAGIDYGVPKGTEVRACAAGRVALAGWRIVTGYTVVLEHMPGIYSLYYHMDKVLAEEGALAEAGELIGLSGATGLATGPHLHWELRVSTEFADPDVFVSAPVLDKKDILNKMWNQE